MQVLLGGVLIQCFCRFRIVYYFLTTQRKQHSAIWFTHWAVFWDICDVFLANRLLPQYVYTCTCRFLATNLLKSTLTSSFKPESMVSGGLWKSMFNFVTKSYMVGVRPESIKLGHGETRWNSVIAVFRWWEMDYRGMFYPWTCLLSLGDEIYSLNLILFANTILG